MKFWQNLYGRYANRVLPHGHYLRLHQAFTWKIIKWSKEISLALTWHSHLVHISKLFSWPWLDLAFLTIDDLHKIQWNHQNKMANLLSNRQFWSTNLMKSSECKKSRWLFWLSNSSANNLKTYKLVLVEMALKCSQCSSFPNKMSPLSK